MITSNANATVKNIRQLRERKARQASGLFFAEGLRIAGELIEGGWEIEQLVIAPDMLVSDYGRRLADAYEQRGGQVLRVHHDVFATLSSKEGPQGIAVVARQRWFSLDDIQPQPGDLWVALDSIADPGNLGTILRTSDAVGGQGIILLDHSTDPYDPSAMRASMGAAISQRLVRCTLADFAGWKRASGVSIIGTSDKAAQIYRSFSYPDPVVLLMGSERHGLQPEHYQICDQVVAIPMEGASDSLNLSVAAGIVLYEIYHQHKAGKQ